MANLQESFLLFYDALQITPTKRQGLITSHNNLRNAVKSYFAVNHPYLTPLFYIQGSYKMGTTIRTSDDECDLDDGIYFIPKPNVTGRTLQNWVVEAVRGITNATPVHKNKCVRVNYAAGYHIDLPVYIKNSRSNEEHPLLAVRDGDYQESDPKEIVNWFKNKKKDNEQLVRLVCYMKAWSDKRPHQLAPSLAWTTLVSDYQFKDMPDRDDIALVRSVEKIYKALSRSFICKVHGTPYDDIFSDYDKDKKSRVLDYLKEFIDKGNMALEEKNKKKASRIWISLLGDRFPEAENIIEEGLSLDNLKTMADSVSIGIVRTNRAGNISEETGISNKPHVFYGD